MNALQQLVATRMQELGLSYRAAAQRSGGNPSHATINNIVTGRHSGRMTEATILGLARALEVPPSRVRSVMAASRKAEVPSRFTLPRRADQLPNSARQIVLALVDHLLELNSGGDERLVHRT